MPKTAHTEATNEIDQQIQALAQQLDLLRTARQREQLRIAKGSSDVTIAARAAVRTQPLPERIEIALRNGVLSFDGLLDVLECRPGNLTTALKDLRDRKAIYNIGTEDRPCWTWILGDEGSTQELIAKLEDLLSIRPFLTQELVDATGARRNRISGALVKLQMRGLPLENHGDRKIARWYLPKRAAKR